MGAQMSRPDLITQGLIQVLSPFLVHYLSGRPQNRKLLMWIGMGTCVAASVGAGFATTVSGAIACY